MLFFFSLRIKYYNKGILKSTLIEEHSFNVCYPGSISSDSGQESSGEVSQPSQKE